MLITFSCLYRLWISEKATRVMCAEFFNRVALEGDKNAQGILNIFPPFRATLLRKEVQVLTSSSSLTVFECQNPG